MPTNRKSQFTEQQKDEFVKQSISFWHHSTHVMQQFFEMVNDIEKMWRVQLPDELADGMAKHRDRAKLAPHDMYVNLKSMRASLRELLFSRKPYGQISLPGKPQVRDEQVQKAELALQSMLDQQSDGKGFEYEADKAIFQALYAGMSAVFTEWRVKTVKQPFRDKQFKVRKDKNGDPVFTLETVAEYGETKALDIRRVRLDPAADKIENVKLVGYHYISSLSDLFAKNRNEEHFYDFDEEDLMASSFNRMQYFEHARGESETYTDLSDQNHDFGDKIAEVWEIRGLFRFEKKDGSVDYHDLNLHVANRKVLLGIQKNQLPFPSYQQFDFPTIETEVGRMFPMGLCEPMMDAWIEKFIKRNQSLDEANRRTYPRYVGDESACQDLPDTIEDIPNQIIKVNTAAAALTSVNAALQPLSRPSTGQDTFQQSVALTDDLQKGMALNDFTQGGDPQRRETATAVNELVSGGRSLLAQIAKNLKDSFLAPSWRKQLILFNFFLGDRLNTVQDDQGNTFQIQPNELQMFYQIDIDIVTQLDQPAMTRRFVEMFPLLQQNPFIDQHSLTKTAIEILKLPNPNRILPPNEHLRQQATNENVALMNGLELPVSQFDNDQLHLQVHIEAVNFVSQDQNAIAQGLTTEALEAHIQAHQESIEAKSNALGNSKDLGGGDAQLRNANAGSITQGTGQTSTIPSGGRA